MKVVIFLLVIGALAFSWKAFIQTDEGSSRVASNTNIRQMTITERQKYYMEQIELIQGAQRAGLESNFLAFAENNNLLYNDVQSTLPYTQDDRDASIGLFLASLDQPLEAYQEEEVIRRIKGPTSNQFVPELESLFESYDKNLSQASIDLALSANTLAFAVRTQQRFLATYEEHSGN